MEFLQSILENYNFPILSALVLGLMTAISPCPLATNITATAFISKNITNKKKVFLSGAIYALGRACSYTIIGLVLYFGVSKLHIARFFNQNGEKYLSILLILIGLSMLGIIKIPFLEKLNFQTNLSEKLKDKGLLGSFLIGVMFALAFCPYSGALFFGMLIPITISSADGLYLPAIFALGTALPVILFTYLLAFATSQIAIFYSKITKIEKVMRWIAGATFILTGLYYAAIFMGII